LSALSAVYGRAAALRRQWYASPSRRRRLSCPVLSVGNLVVGGSGKTPTVATLARLLQALGERPAILSRGYGRTQPAPGVVVVSDGAQVLATAAQSGDES
jgi:tetraacyldisaccharide 4'-kinase